MIPSRPRLEAARAARGEQDLVDFCEYLLAALEVPEIRAAIAAVVAARQRADRMALSPGGPVTVRGRRDKGRR